ncbi:hypothetical protein PPOLYM_01744 [Paenibacillus polymyxa]|uniref:Uncharacterized protein n=1 Tax=Paenibacillus peoriae TaxID=59893 RepID=A0ABU1QDR1_9BACL|nr:hypothetical protein [Paenibacillus peoriae]VUG05364.1 hypothetical protein PPOLYM_01744 [Paenibacillus polymyxa]
MVKFSDGPLNLLLEPHLVDQGSESDYSVNTMLGGMH